MNTPSSRPSLFLTELVLNVLIFSICSVVCVVLLVRSHTIRQQSEAVTQAVYLAQSVAEVWKVGGDLTPLTDAAPYPYTITHRGNSATIPVWDDSKQLLYQLDDLKTS